MSNFEEFFAGRDELLEQYLQFDSKYNLNIISHLKEESDSGQFLSMITEVNFGIYFSTLASSITYQPKFCDVTPDWLVTINGQEVILEVLRLNAASHDKFKLDLIEKFIDKASCIPKGVVLSFSILEGIDLCLVDLDACIKNIEVWLETFPQQGESIVLFDCFEIELVDYSSEISNVCVIGMGGPINFDYRRLSGPNSPLLKKVRKYSNVVEKQNLPYIICMYADFHTWFKAVDLYESLYGPSCTDLCGEFPAVYTMIEQGLFYQKGNEMESVSGILLRMGDKHSYFHNFSRSNRLNESNKVLFEGIQYVSD